MHHLPSPVSLLVPHLTQNIGFKKFTPFIVNKIKLPRTLIRGEAHHVPFIPWATISHIGLNQDSRMSPEAGYPPNQGMIQA